MKKTWLTFGAALPALGVAMAFPAHAQTDATPSASTSEIIVTAQKREERLNDVPISISAISGDNLRALGVDNPEDLAKVVPGFSYTLSAYQTPVYFIRGVGYFESSLSADPGVSVYVDEVPLAYSAMTVGASLDLERVEVLKGPQGILFGRNSTGGAINYVAARPTNEFRAGLDASYGTYSEVNLGGFVSGPISDTVRARFSVRSTTASAWQRSMTRDEKNGAKDFLIGRLLVDWDASEDLTFNLNINGWRDHSDSPAPQLIGFIPRNPANIPLVPEVFANPPAFAPDDAEAADWTPGRSYANDNNLWQVSLRTNYDISAIFDLVSLTSYVEYNRDTSMDQDGFALLNVNTYDNGKVKSFMQEVRLNATTDRFRGVIGASYEDSRVRQFLLSELLNGSGSFVAGVRFSGASADSDQTAKTSAIFGNAEYDIGQFTIHGGLRYTKTKRDFNECGRDSGDGTFAAVIENLQSIFKPDGPVIPIAPGECAALDANVNPARFFAKTTEDNVSWRAGISWQGDDGLLLYANATRGFKAGGFPTTTAASIAQFTPVAEERVDAYEAGFKAPLADGLFQLNGAIFQMDYKDKQVRGFIPDPVFRQVAGLVSIPKSRIRGGEIQVTGRPFDGVNFDLGATYLDTEIREGTGLNLAGAQTDFQGTPLPYTPKKQAFLNLRYTRDMTGDVSAFGAANINYRSDANASLGFDPRSQIKAYTTLGLEFGLESHDGLWRASVFGENVTNKFYWTSVNLLTDALIRYAGQPRHLGARLALRF